MPRAKEMRPSRKAEQIPCTAERGAAHHWQLGDVEDRHVPGRCTFCGLSRDFPAFLPTYESWAATIVAPKRGAL